jgi:tRNA pseudouridine13 synthase
MLPDWPRSFSKDNEYGHAPIARIRACPEDFRVDEELGFSPDGEGEHSLLHIQKRNRNTDQIARQLARHAGVRARDVSYCGLKDRVAVTSQWFSVWLPGKEDPDWSSMEDEGLKILEQSRHRRKLQRGALQGNRFEIVLRDIFRDNKGEQSEIEKRLSRIKQQGVPNYFGEQRFGRDGGNLLSAQTMFEGKRIKDRFLRGVYLSSARSFLFNEVLAERVRKSNWNTIVPGEAIMLDGSRSFFVCDQVDEVIAQRLKDNDIHPSGPLWGRGELSAQDEAGKLEKTVVASHSAFCEGLEKAGLKQERRALRLSVNDLQWTWLDGLEQEAGTKTFHEKRTSDLQLTFTLPAGAYATAVLREVVSTSQQ